WGHNNGTLAALETNDIPDGVEARSERIWYINEVNGSGDVIDIGNLNLTFQLNNLGPITASDLVLLIDTDQDGVFADETPIIGAYDLNNNSYTFQTITSLNDGSRFTFGSSNLSNTPLPVSLLHFKANTLNEDILEFAWITATELHNDHFEIEQSGDGINWQPILKINGAGTTKELTTYTAQYNDERCNERTYYKLSQVDEEGKKVGLQIIKVERDRTKDVFIFPNPATDFVMIQSAELLHTEVYDSHSKLLKSSKDNIIDVSDLVSGTYLMHIQLVNRLVIKKLVINTSR
ncbi:MAG: T9SS C-terminal target domain-containing protein, partial [Cytophagia bacterium]|nr:T9SS C-terminal target domain-containing protein [Cytophagia bacterium]